MRAYIWLCTWVYIFICMLFFLCFCIYKLFVLFYLFTGYIRFSATHGFRLRIGSLFVFFFLPSALVIISFRFLFFFWTRLAPRCWCINQGIRLICSFEKWVASLFEEIANRFQLTSVFFLAIYNVVSCFNCSSST